MLIFYLTQADAAGAHTFALVLVLAEAALSAMLGATVPGAVRAGQMPVLASVVALVILEQTPPTITAALVAGATLLFFAKIYKLDRDKLSDLLLKVFDQDAVLRVLTEGGHSTELQSYLVETIPELVPVQDDLFDAAASFSAG